MKEAKCSQSLRAGSRVRVVFLRHGQEVGVNLTRMPGFKIGGVQSSPPVLAAKVDLIAGRAAQAVVVARISGRQHGHYLA